MAEVEGDTTLYLRVRNKGQLHSSPDTKLNCEGTHRNSLHESILLLTAHNLNHCCALYPMSQKKYDENKTNFGEIHLIKLRTLLF